MKTIVTLFLVTLLLGLLGARFQTDYDQIQDTRIENLESSDAWQSGTLDAMTAHLGLYPLATQEFQATPTPLPRFLMATNRSGSRIRIRACTTTTCAILGYVENNETVSLCPGFQVTEEYTWGRIPGKGYVAADFLVTGEQGDVVTGDQCD